jgi:UPF0755 protein
MKKTLQNMLHIFLLSVLLVALACLFSYHYLQQPGPLAVPTNIIIRKGMKSQAIAEELARAGVVRYHYVFYATQLVTGKTKKFKAGEYAFAAGITPNEVAEKLVSGDVVVHKITIPEGWNMREIRAAIMADNVLEGDITRPIPEGSILPETYHYTYGDTRDGVVARMQAALEKALEDAWNKRTEGLPLRTKEEALVLASIVEKETGVAGERARVAAVFINRLRLGMRLQTDPTVVYGIEQKLGDAMNRELTRADLEIATPYNTYVINGLPPTPIASPGRGALEAVMHPAQTDELYFVATGTGGHNFAKTLEEHNKNVAAYRAALANAPR